MIHGNGGDKKELLLCLADALRAYTVDRTGDRNLYIFELATGLRLNSKPGAGCFASIIISRYVDSCQYADL